MLQKYICLVFLLFHYAIGSERLHPVVHTNVGSIRGLRATDGNYFMYMGIPYAAVDENNPFGESTPYPHFNGTFEAYDDTAMCPQLFNGTNLGSLDCLNLNVYVPSTATSNNSHAVMVYFHGGAFNHYFGGRYLYGPKYLVGHNVILVTLNYRLGPYGFMCLDVPEVSGNQGLKDQLIALRWVKNNIGAFGGDANKITLFGHSSGGFSVHLHLLSPKEILYNKIIVESGIRAIAPDVFGNPDNSVALELAQYLGSKTRDVHEALSFLAKCNTNLVIEAATNLSLVFAPCKELELDGVDSFITQSYMAAKVTKVKDMPVMIGFNEQEMAWSIHNAKYSYLKSLNLISEYLKQSFDMDNETLEEMKNIIGHFYFGDNGSDVNVTLEVTKFDSDYSYIHPIQKTIEKYLESGAESIFYYMFSYIGGMNALPDSASHGDQIRYMFDMKPYAAKRKREDKTTIERMTTMWTNFAKYSNPTPKTTDILPVKWLPLTKDMYYYLKIDKELSLGRRPLHKRMAFWDMFDLLIRKSQL